MKIKKSQAKQKFLYLLLILLIAGIVYVGYVAYFKPADNSNNTDTNYNAPTRSQINAGQQAKIDTVENDKSASNSAKNESTSSEASNAPFTTDITAHKVNAGILQIRNVIDGIHSTGTCTLTLSKNSQTITKTADIQPLPQSSTCEGFDIPISQLSSGTWQVMLKVTIGGKTAVSTVSINI